MRVPLPIFLCTCALSVAIIESNRAQTTPPQYRIVPQTFSGGGGRSTSGNYAVVGSIGLPHAGPTSASEAYSVTGGPWSLEVIIHEQGAPPAMVIEQASDGQVLIRWVAQGEQWILQQSEALPGGWTSAPEPVSRVGDEDVVVVNPTGEERFFRLFKP